MLGPSQPRLHLSACTTSAAESGVGAMIPTGLEPSSLRSSVVGRSALSAAPPALPPLPTTRTCSPWSIGAPPGSAADTDRSSESRANARGPTAPPSTSVMVTANSTTTAICVRNAPSLAVVHERVRESWGGDGGTRRPGQTGTPSMRLRVNLASTVRALFLGGRAWCRGFLLVAPTAARSDRHPDRDTVRR